MTGQVVESLAQPYGMHGFGDDEALKDFSGRPCMECRRKNFFLGNYNGSHVQGLF